ncbi:unnamed protein product [Mytilus edulis]|uniref:Uncharacterized protein n=1 Tax=Mytilus edulis TaxID=6550 RepID=A0A8S3PX45_MYTED|nr:unnamed protein product [Mytilus edulis]
MSTKEDDTQVLINMAHDFAYMEGYELQPQKSVALNLLSKTHKKNNTNECIFNIGNNVMPNVKQALHLGIIRTTSMKENVAINVEENIKKARRSAYGLFGGGFHGHNGLDPETLVHLFKTYISPVLLYGMELLLPKTAMLLQLEKFQKRLLKQLLSLPTSTPDPAVYILSGILPVEAQIDKRALGLFNNICNQDESSTEKQLARRQISVKSLDSGWTSNNEVLRIALLKSIGADVVSVNETHLKDNDKLELRNQGYEWFGFNRHSVHRKAPKEFLTDSKFCVLNGRFGEKSNQYTSISSRGKAVVDYICVPHDIIGSCKDFKIVPCGDVVGAEGIQNLIDTRCKIPDHAFLVFDYHYRYNLNSESGNGNKTDINNDVKTDQNRKHFKLRSIPADFMCSDIIKQTINELIRTIEICREEQGEIDSIYAAIVTQIFVKWKIQYRSLIAQNEHTENISYDKNLNCNKPSGPDGVSPRILKEIKSGIVKPLTLITLLDKLSAYGVDIDLNLILFGDQSMSIEDNVQIVKAVHEYIKNSERFV